jgi:hypothetical protein
MLSHVPTAPSTDSGRILDFADNSSNISELGFPGPIPSTCELPDSLEWCVNNNAGNLCMNEVDQTYNDPELNWDLFLDDVNFNCTMDISNTIF